MPGQHDKHKHQTVIKLSHDVWRQIEKDAAVHKMNPTEYMRWVLMEHVHNVPLTAEDYEIIHARIKAAFEKGRPV